MDDSVNLIPIAIITEASTIHVSTLTTGPRLDAVMASRLSIPTFSLQSGENSILEQGQGGQGLERERVPELLNKNWKPRGKQGCAIIHAESRKDESSTN